jgi:transcriptional regulator with PAS, ATPase and Fis domain
MMNLHGPLIGCSEKAEEMREAVRSIACSNLTVMILGERGTGKDLVASEIHLKSNRPGQFVRVNCASLPEELVESELFGCEKGAYTGAESRKGKFEQADRGTIFLDEVGELSPKAQPKLLHVTDTRAVDRIGGQRSIPVDFRLIVATNQNLEDMVRQGKFRADLYDRLNMDIIRVPPLRERMDDVPLLADYFRGRCADEARREVTDIAQQVLDLFQQYLWPGNIRELQQTIKRAVYKGHSDMIRLEDLPFDFAKKTAEPAVMLGDYRELMQAYSRHLVVTALTRCNGDRGKVAKASKLLNLSQSQLYRLIDVHGLDKPSSRKGKEGMDWIP